MEKNTRKEPVPTGAGSPFFMCRQQALRYLGLREHNRIELRTKLLNKGYDAGLVDSVLDDLIDDGSLSERRYVESFVRSSNRRHPEGKSLVIARLLQKVLTVLYVPRSWTRCMATTTMCLLWLVRHIPASFPRRHQKVRAFPLMSCARLLQN